MPNRTRKTSTDQIIRQKNALDKAPLIKLNDILFSENNLIIIQQCREFRERIFTPLVTLLTFIKQVLDPDKSCKKAVSMVNAIRLSEGIEPCSSNTGPYCKARKRLPESMITELVEKTGAEMESICPQQWKWKGRNVNVVDGTTILMPETLANQAAYPKHKNQADGVALPIMRLLVIFSLATGTVLKYVMAPMSGKGTGERSLLKAVFKSVLKSKDILLGDSGFQSFFLLSDLIEMGYDGLFQALPYWKFNINEGIKLGKNDYIVTWKKPNKKSYMDKEIYDKYPKYFQIRVFKAKGNVYITTLLEHKKYRKNELSELYGLRWHAELNLRNIKTIMNMRNLTCKTPEMVRKEVGVNLLAYNIIRILMAESGYIYNISPKNLSFKNTIQYINSFMFLFTSLNKNERLKIYKKMLYYISYTIIGNRPGRKEPRAVKMRVTQFPLLKMNRNVYRKKLYAEEKIKAAAA